MKKLVFAFIFSTLFITGLASAAPSGLTLQGRLVKDQTAVSGPVTLTVSVMSPNTDLCYLYEETHSLNLSTSDDGIFSVQIGAGTRSTHDKGFALVDVFSNTGTAIPSLTCTGSVATSYTPLSGHSRYVYLSFNTSVGTVAFSDPYVVQSVPYALEAEKLAGRTSTEYLQTTANTTQTKINDLMVPATYTELLAILNGSSAQYMTTSNSGPTKLPVLSSTPNSPTAGQIWYQGGSLKYYDGSTSSVKTLGSSTGGTVTSVATGTGLTGGPITSSGTVSLASGVIATPGTYSSVTVDTYGRVTAGASPTTVSGYGITDAVIKGGQTGSVTLGPSDANSLTLNTSGSPRMTILSGGNVGIGTTSPSSKLSVMDSDTSPGISLTNTSSTSNRYPQISVQNYNGGIGGAPIFGLFSSRGSLSSPAALQSGDSIGLIIGYGHDGTSTNESSRISFAADETFSSTARGGRISFSTVASGTITETERMRITSSGNVGIGTTSPLAPLHVLGVNGITSMSSTSSLGLAVQGGTNWNDLTGIDFRSAIGGAIVNPIARIGSYATSNGSYLQFATSNSWPSGPSRLAMTIDYIGNVGIGTTTPLSALDVKGASGDASGNGVMRYNTGTGTNDTGLKIGGVAGAGSAGYAFIQGVHTGAASDLNLVLNPLGGNVGIGTTSPAGSLGYSSAVRALEVSGSGSNSATSAGLIEISNNKSAAPAAGDWSGFLDFVSNGNGTGTNQVSARLSSELEGSGGPNGIGANFRIYTKADNGSFSERMRISSSGNVGIGTTSPGSILHLSSNTPIISLTDTGTSTVNTVANNTGALSFNTGGANSIIFNLGGVEKMRLLANTGYVGIGTTSPQVKLDISGTMRMTKNSGAPYACTATVDAALAVTSQYTTCICNGGTTTWVKTTDGTTACAW